MKIALCHLSDIHIQKDPKLNTVFKKKDCLLNAIRRVVDNNTYIFLIVSGDISFSGAKPEYNQALDFFSDLYIQLDDYSDKSCFLLFVPGNHDCDFSDSKQNKFVESFRAKISNDESKDLIEEICKLFSNFYSFEENFNSKDFQIKNCTFLIKQKEYKLNNFKILFNLVNTAWLSEKKEKPGVIFIPKNQYVDFEENHLSITIFHHPFNYLKNSELYEFKNYITKNSDLIFVGHGHNGNEEKIESRLSNYNYNLGDALQDTEDSTNSGFSITLFNLTNSTTKKAVASWNSKQRLYKVEIKAEEKFQRNVSISSLKLNLNEDYLKFLNSHDIEIQHRFKENVTLEDLYIYPDLKIFEETSKKSFIVIKSDEVFKYILDKKRVILTGDSNYGKTALSKKLCLDFYNQGFLPLLINAKDIQHHNEIEDMINSEVIKQYSPDLVEKYKQSEKREKVIIIDDFDKINLNATARQEFLDKIKQKYEYVMLFTNITYEIGVLMDSIDVPFEDFIMCDIKEMGHYLRRKLIMKWYSLGREHNISDEKLEQLYRDAEKTINVLRGEGGYWPTIPSHLLIILQQLDASILNENISSYGYLYEFLISRSIVKLIDNEIIYNADIVNGLLIETAYYMFSNQKKLLDDQDLIEIEKLYNEEYDEDINYKQFIQSFVDVNIFKHVNFEVTFKYSYIYYYFIAKYLSNNIEEKYVLDHINHMTKRLFNEEYGNIIIFLCHISKNTNIINSIIANSMSIFEEYDLCDFTCQNKLLKQIGETITDITDSISLKTGSVSDHNNSFAQEKDNQELIKPQEKFGEYYDETEDPILNKMLNINKAFKTMEVMGQILKNYPGTLKGKIKKDLIQNTYNLGMRTLSVMYDILEEDIESLVDNIKNKLYNNIPDVKIDEYVTAIKSKAIQKMSLLAFVVTYGMIRKISFCISNEALLKTINKIRSEGNVSFRLVYTSIMLNNIGKLHSQELLRLYHDFINSNNKFASGLLKQMLSDHFYFFGIKDYATCQKVCDTLKIGKPDKKLLWK